MNRPNRYENDSYAGFMRRAVRAFGRRAETDLDALRMMVELRAELDASIASAARLAHDGEGAFSWTEIGDALGMSRQAARQRFAPSPQERLEARRAAEAAGTTGSAKGCGHLVCTGRALCAFREAAAQR